jgi:hypothetical protein
MKRLIVVALLLMLGGCAGGPASGYDFGGYDGYYYSRGPRNPGTGQ